MSKGKPNPLSIIGPYKVVGNNVFNAVADPSRLNAFIPLLTTRNQTDAMVIAQLLNERFGPDDETPRVLAP